MTVIIPAGDQSPRAGVYSLVPSITRDGRPVYKKGNNYLFYWISSQKWMIGSDYTKDSAGVKSEQGEAAQGPELATGWQTWTKKKWVTTPGIMVTGASCIVCPTHSIIFVRAQTDMIAVA